jgi:cytochrome c oxidase assembly protein subunit 15
MAAVPSSITSAPSRSSQQAIVVWLLIVAALVFAMVVVGGVTRLTRSGLSIVEWKPIMGAIPPLTEQSWMAEFAKYQLTPEYEHVNSGMSLEGFKEIFYVEWAHRLLGRVIGLVVFIPLIYFVVRKRISSELLPKVITILILGGLQGALGWFMVKSGLVDIPRVSPYRLTAHLALAIGIYAYILWVVFDLRESRRNNAVSDALSRMSWTVTALLGLMILAGGFVAGTKAGFVFNTFPLMSGQFAPPGMYALQPWWSNLFENVATVQFNHRLLAYVLAIAGCVFYWLGLRSSLDASTRRALHLFLVALFAQIALGISTLLLIVPVWLGAIHQGGALVVLTFALYLNHALRRPT